MCGVRTADVSGESQVLANAAKVLVCADEEVAVAAPGVCIVSTWSSSAWKGLGTSRRCAPWDRLPA